MIAVDVTGCHGPSTPWPTFAQRERGGKIDHPGKKGHGTQKACSGRDDTKCKPATPTPVSSALLREGSSCLWKNEDRNPTAEALRAQRGGEEVGKSGELTGGCRGT